MKIIGLTGGIGSGKSTVAQFLTENGAIVLDADKIGHEAFKPRSEGWSEVVAAFGERVLTRDRGIDRKKLGQLVFSDPVSLAQLNRILHPRIYTMVKARLDEYRKQGVQVVVLEAPLLLEVGWSDLVDEVWVTVAPQDVILKRLSKRSRLARADALARTKAQLPVEERLKHADAVIDTNCTWLN
jgi:dephospho-CoA kinase